MDISPAATHAPEKRFVTLDGMRGLASIAVLVSHSAPAFCAIPVLRNWYAVDLFFMLSGFVLCRVYEPRFALGMTARQFLLQRYIRLYPLFALGIVIGLLAEALAFLSHHGRFDAGQGAIALVTGLAILPSPTMQATPEIIPFNAVGWSLFFELVANYIYVTLWPRLNGKLLLAIVLASAIGLLWGAFRGASFGGTSWPTFWGGFPRVMFCFFTGVLIARGFDGRQRQSAFVWLLLAVILLLLLTPWPDADVRDVLIMMGAFPVLVAVGARIEPANSRLFLLFGRLSYPIYAVHYPLYLCFVHGLFLLGLKPDAVAPWGGIGFVLLICSFAYVLDRSFDVPARRWLSCKFYVRPGAERRLISPYRCAKSGPNLGPEKTEKQAGRGYLPIFR